MNHSLRQITTWLKTQHQKTKTEGFVVGVSGGIDSAVTSTLCAKTSLPTIVCNLPIHQNKKELKRAIEHIEWLKKNFANVKDYTVDLTSIFDHLSEQLPQEAKTDLSLANTRSRLRMTTLYTFANTHNYLVCGTGNKIEDYGIGFFTKYGDGGVDISPIGDLVKSQVYELGKYLKLSKSIQKAQPTDGLWDGSPSDEKIIGASYDELAKAMNFCEENSIRKMKDLKNLEGISKREKEVLKIYLRRHIRNKHKMRMPRVCKTKEDCRLSGKR